MRTLLNHGWIFARTAPDAPADSVPAEAWQSVTLPHDWLIADENDLYATGDGLYRRTLTVPEEEAGLCRILRFDGVYMDCEVRLNGDFVCAHAYGYTAFDADLTGRVRPGDNLLEVRVRYRCPNSRWYSGAGIFRDVSLSVLPACHLVPDGVYPTPRRRPDGLWTVDLTAEIAGPDPGQRLRARLLGADGRELAAAETPADAPLCALSLPAFRGRCWSPDEPALYTLEVCLAGDCLRLRIGLRQTRLDPDTGLWLNGEHVKLHGVCLHHDLGLLGSAFHPKAARRQLTLMKVMGVNALRTSHNPPAAALLDLCDELGILVVDEAFDMWMEPKTEFDYARFFRRDAEADVARWVRRDRSHVCVLMWSVGNEIHDTLADPEAPEWTRRLCAWVRRHDPDGHALTTLGSNYMPWEGARRCAAELDAVGCNYDEKDYAALHAAHPDWILYGSETGSLLASRGVYHFPLAASILSEEDLQCSALGNSNTSWGAQDIAQMLADDLNTPYSLGQFVWSGIDYIGEPTPYHTRCCYFGQADTALFRKDSYYQFQAAWTEKPMAHIGVPWDWNEGQLVDVPCCTNLPWAELFLNGVSLGRKRVDVRDAALARPVWRVPFTPGALMLRCYTESGHLKAQTLRCTPGDPVRLVAEAEDRALLADGRDLTFLTVKAVDAGGLPVENAADRVYVSVEGPAALLGVDNGDSTDPDGFRQDSRCLFGGLLRVALGMAAEPGLCTVTLRAEGLESAVVRVEALPAECPHPVFPPSVRHVAPGEARRLRALRLTASGSTRLTPEHPCVDVALQCLPENAPPQEVTWRVVNAAGISSGAARAEEIPGGVRVQALGDGDVYLRASATNGANHPRILSQLEISVRGFGTACLNPYGFVAAGLYDLHSGEIGAGNEQGVAFAREGESMAGFTHVDFGPAGSREITLPVFALDSDLHEITLWDGDPREGGEAVAVLPYRKPSVWNTYQEETWTLPRTLKGVHTLCFSLREKVHLKGFRFTPLSRADSELTAADLDEVYGDSFRRTEEAVEDIGNNTVLLFRGVDLRGGGAYRLTLEGRTPLAACDVQLRLTGPAGEETTALCPFAGGPGWSRQTFPVTAPAGVCDAALVFLPGARFSFRSCRLTPSSGKEETDRA